MKKTILMEVIILMKKRFVVFSDQIGLPHSKRSNTGECQMKKGECQMKIWFPLLKK